MLDFATTAFVSILFLVDPPGTVPAFMALTAKYSPAKRRKTALVASVVATTTLMGFAAVGNVIFRGLGLTLPAFQIAGGIILFLVALDMIRAQRTTQEDPDVPAGSRESDPPSMLVHAVFVMEGRDPYQRKVDTSASSADALRALGAAAVPFDAELG